MDDPAVRARATAQTLGQWLVLGALVGVLGGLASALFLWLLDVATGLRVAHRTWVLGLPIAGVVLGKALERWGAPIKGGNNVVIDAVHEEGPPLPLRMAPMVLIGTIWTHLFGGSAGREGTAVQMGASLADSLSHALGVSRDTRRLLLSAGIAGGFGSVFGTPLAGTLFGLEVVTVGRLEYRALLPALAAAVVGDAVTRGAGITHTPYPVVAALPMTPMLLAKWLAFAAAAALTAVVFVEGVHGLKRWLEKRVPASWMRMLMGGLGVLALNALAGTDDYLGLGVPTILRAFNDPALPAIAFAWKAAFTIVTVGAGFMGGEVTPLFFIGAALGNVLGRGLGLPLDLAAGVGMAAVFAAAANTPLALSIMAVELLGAAVLPHVAIVAAVACLLTGHRGIYPAQRLVRRKWGAHEHPPVALRELDLR